MSEIQENQTSTDDSGIDDKQNTKQFLCGVVEGFYGKPWTFSQRKDLFKRLKELNLNSFMYAPKDDAKHRAKWRQLYNEIEANELRILIEAAESKGIDFYYSLAPGLDMVYSSQEDLAILKQKFDQLKSLGCRSFAILFDDIEPRIINEKDKSAFDDNYGLAQVSVSNMIYEYLNKPKFLFCPTEYCESRAVPTVSESIYLNTIGSGLHKDIDFLWSGSRVISRFITEDSIQELSRVIRRPPVIWENLHANDYDKKRVYLGPYSGRSTRLIPKLRGVLTNPNCEYEANYIAIHTLAQWSRCTQDVNPHNRCNQATQMETAIGFSESRNDNDERRKNQQDEDVYDPDKALARALRDWLPHVLSKRSLPVGDELLTRDMRDDAVAEVQITKEIGCEVQHDDHLKNIEVDMVDSKMSSSDEMPPTSGSSSGTSKTSNDMDTSSGSPVEVGKSDLRANNELEKSSINQMVADSNSNESCEMQDLTSTGHQQSSNVAPIKQPDPQPILDLIVESTNNSNKKSNANNTNNNNSLIHKVDIEGLSLLVDFFYLPFEHGLRGHALLSDIKWLIDNSHVFLANRNQDRTDGDDQAKMHAEDEQHERKSSSPIVGDIVERDSCSSATSSSCKMVELWVERAERLNALCSCINRILGAMIHDCPNKLITAELYPYLAELSDVILLTLDYIKFLRHRRSHADRFYYSCGPRRREHVAQCDEQEPWVHRGGLIGDMQRLIS